MSGSVYFRLSQGTEYIPIYFDEGSMRLIDFKREVYYRKFAHIVKTDFDLTVWDDINDTGT